MKPLFQGVKVNIKFWYMYSSINDVKIEREQLNNSLRSFIAHQDKKGDCYIEL